MARKKKVSKKAAVKSSRKASKRSSKKASVRRQLKIKGRTGSSLKAIPAILQTVAQVEKMLSGQEKEHSQLSKKLEAKHKKAVVQKEKADAKLNSLQQKAGDKGVPAAKLKPLQKVLNTAQSECEALEGKLSHSQEALEALQKEIEILQYIKEAVNKLENQ